VITALVIGTILAVGALAFVLYPVFFGVTRPPSVIVTPRLNEGESAVAALREIEFDRATGKLSESDYDELKARYTKEAIAVMRRRKASPAGAALDDEIEAAVKAYRETHASCPEHGPRPEADAAYCSECGRYLSATCAGCGAPVTEHDARFCARCGVRLAA
jgi:hypothetical protein